MNFKFILFIWFILIGQIFPQNYKPLAVIGDFNSAAAFSITPAGNIYVTDAGTNEIYKLDTLGNIIDYIGGFGWDPSAFDYPADVYANTLKTLVTDKNNHRIQVFDKNLNFLYEFSTEELENQQKEFSYPVSAATSAQGDLYILDSDNQRVVKFDINGNYILEIGSFDAGNFSLQNPKRLAVSQNELLFVADKNQIIVFDRFGTGIAKLPSPVSPENINILFNNLSINNSDSIFTINLAVKDWTFTKILSAEELPVGIVEASVFKNKLYVLTRKNIHIFVR